MKMEITAAGISEIINEIRKDPKSLFEMIRGNVQETVGVYLSTLMEMELTQFLGRDHYERSAREINHRNGSYGRKFTLKGIAKVDIRVPRDREGEFNPEVIPPKQTVRGCPPGGPQCDISGRCEYPDPGIDLREAH